MSTPFCKQVGGNTGDIYANRLAIINSNKKHNPYSKIFSIPKCSNTSSSNNRLTDTLRNSNWCVKHLFLDFVLYCLFFG